MAFINLMCYIICVNHINSKWGVLRKGDNMDIVPELKRKGKAYVIDDAMQMLFSKLDEGLVDFENGRVISEEEMWEELDAI